MKARESEVLAKYFNIIESFRGKKGIGMGDIRAYISALADLEVIETGIKKREDLIEILSEILNRMESSEPPQDYKDTLRKWVNIDKSILSEYSRNIKCRGVPEGTKLRSNGFSSISLFSGSFGLDLGFEWAGFDTRVAVDIDPASKEIISANRPEIPFILDDIKNIPTETLLETAGEDKGDIDVLTGGPPCQPFSTAGKRMGLNDPRASPLREYIRVINEAKPKIFVMEEVTGLLNARIKHVPIKERGKRKLLPEERKGSVWKVILDELKNTGYRIFQGVLDAADYGTPQKRKRVIIIGLRPDLKVKIPLIPEKTHKKPNLPSLKLLKPWRTLFDAIMGIEPGEFINLPPKYATYMRYVPAGGNWRQIPDRFKREAMNNALYAGGGKMGFYRRLCWFEPSPTLVTSPSMKGSMMIHPWEERPLSVNEYKAIQGFPLDWELPGSVTNKYKKVGEAVPPTLSYAIARNLAKALKEVDKW
ncbi:MAG: DNA cytosine methyltransferase [Thermoplasmatales archaeon]|nr:DNA cytosine methyltransferase [Thermoplasmatales archaeon]